MDTRSAARRAPKSKVAPDEEGLSDLWVEVKAIRKEVAKVRQEIRSAIGDIRGLDDPAPKLLSRDEAAERLSISTRTLDDREAAGEIRSVRIGGRVLYAPATIDAFIRRCMRREVQS